jgi:hypothetical protein
LGTEGSRPLTRLPSIHGRCLAPAGIAKADADAPTVDVHRDAHRDHTFPTLLSKSGVVPAWRRSR